MKANVDRAWDQLKQHRPQSKLDEADRRRFCFAAELVVGKSVIDIGTGDGVFAWAMANSSAFDTVSALDYHPYVGALFHPCISYIVGSVADGRLRLGQHDTVVCMEVLEHLEAQDARTALGTLRETAEERLVVTVPYREPQPLWNFDKPGGHRQTFSFRNLATLFPGAVATIYPRYGIDWMFIVEDRLVRPPEFQLIARDKFVSLLNRGSSDSK